MQRLTSLFGRSGDRHEKSQDVVQKATYLARINPYSAKSIYRNNIKRQLGKG